MGEAIEIKTRESEDKWVHDSSRNHKGRVPLRASTGVWKAALFIVTVEFSERLSYFGIATNLITYLTKVLHQDLKTAAKNVNYWTGVTTVMPLVGGFLADAYTGRFTMVLLSSFIYLLGLMLLTMSQFIPSLKPCNQHTPPPCHSPSKPHLITFFVAIYFLSLGTGFHKPCLQSFGADQFDDNNPQERRQKMSYFNWWSIALCAGVILGVTIVSYVQDDVSSGAAFLMLTVVMGVTVGMFVAGVRYYRYRRAEGSPLTAAVQVLAAAVRKRRLALPPDTSLLYEVPVTKGGRRLGHTNRLRFLDKAAIIEDRETEVNPWRLATVTRVEELKLLVSIAPIWLTSLIFGVTISQASTFYVKQASAMDRTITPSFEIPAAAVYSLAAISMIVSIALYDKILIPILRKITGDERGIKILQRIGIGMVVSVIGVLAAALVEKKRLDTARIAGTKAKMSVFWLAPQYVIHGIGDAFALVGLQEYFYDQVPESMRSLGIALYLSVMGVGSFLSSFLITVVDRVTESVGEKNGGWIGKDLNSSRLDYFYWLLVVLNGLNLCVYVFIAKGYTYKNVERRRVVDSPNESELMA